MTGREVTLPPVDKSHITNATAADYKDLDELRRRVADTVFAIKVCVEKDEQLEAIRSVIEVKWQDFLHKKAKSLRRAYAKELDE